MADAFGVRTDDLVEWNNLDPGAKLHPSMVLQIFVRKDFDPAGVVLLDPSKVRVVTLGSEEFLELETARRGKKRLIYSAKPGDTLAKLGRRYGLTPGDLARINRFSYNTELHEGDKVVVYSPTGDAPQELTRGMASGEKRPERATAGGERVERGEAGQRPADRRAGPQAAAPAARFQEEGRHRCRETGPDEAGARKAAAPTTAKAGDGKKK